MPPNADPPGMDILDCPRVIQLETTTRCNLRCVMCAAKKSPVHRTDMPEALYARIIADLAGHADKIENLCLFMDGEPLLDKRLPRFIAPAKAAGLRTVQVEHHDWAKPGLAGAVPGHLPASHSFLAVGEPSAVVTAILLMIVADAVFAVLFNAIGI